MRASDKVLHDALLKAGHADLAERAKAGEWNDYFGPHPAPQHHLVATLFERARTLPGGADKAIELKAIAERAMRGDFDGTKEEAEEWAASDEGQATFRELLG
jgi:hypothetical protein